MDVHINFNKNTRVYFNTNSSIFIYCIVFLFYRVSVSYTHLSVTSHGVTYALKNMITQSVYVIAGAGVMIFIARVFKTRYITYSASMKLYLLGIFLMIICIFFGSTKGSHAWIKFGSLFSIQPAEFMKVAMILIMSYFLTESDKAFVCLLYTSICRLSRLMPITRND